MEGGEVVVTLLLFGTSATDVVVTVQTKDGSAGMYYTLCGVEHLCSCIYK